jgi:cytochrome P450
VASREELGWPAVPRHLEPFYAFEQHSLLELEPPVHTRLRSLVNRSFLSRQVERLRPMIASLSNLLIDRFEAEHEVDLLAAYATPIPASHLETIFEICHFSATDRRQFLQLYRSAHPRKLLSEAPQRGTVTVVLPDLGDAARNRLLQELVNGVVRDIAKLVDAAGGDHRKRGKRR